jgi:hypothetical protein
LKDRLAAAKSSRIPIHTKAFLFGDIAHKALAELFRNIQVGTRFERIGKEKENTIAAAEAEADGMEAWDDDEVAEDFEELAMEMNEEENRRELAYEEGMAWIRREFGDGGRL